MAVLNGEALIEQIDGLTILPNSLAIWGLGQMGLIVKGPDAVVYLDPFLSESLPGRAFPPPLKPHKAAHADWVLVSHEHPDHLDKDTLKPMAEAAPSARFVAPGWCVEALVSLGIDRSRILVPTVMQPIDLPDTTLQLTALPAAHYDKEHDAEKGYRYLGYLLEWNAVTLYFAGDTLIYDDYIKNLRALPKADIAVLPVNGRDYFREQQGLRGNLLPGEAAQLAVELGWSLVIAGHNDLFAANRLPMGEVAAAFAQFAPRQPYKFLQPGELLYYVKA